MILILLGFHGFWNQHSLMTTKLLFTREQKHMIVYESAHFTLTILSILSAKTKEAFTALPPLWFYYTYFGETYPNSRWKGIVQNYCEKKKKRSRFLFFLDCTKSIWKFARLQYYYRKLKLLWFKMSSSRKKVRIHNPWGLRTYKLITFSTFEVRIHIWVWININIPSRHLVDEKCFLQKEELLLLLLNSS